MSLINDALKRARHAQQKSRPPTPSPPALRPVAPRPPGPDVFPIGLPLALLVLAGAAGLMLWLLLNASGAGPSGITVARAKSPAAAIVRQPARAAVETELAPSAPRPPTATQASRPEAAPAGPALAAGAPAAPVPVAATATAEGEPSQPPMTLPPGETASSVSLTQAVAEASGPPPPPPLPRLQGIFYRPDRPTALLDGRLVSVGRASGDYRVVAISQQAVTVVRAGQTNLLELPD